MQLTKFAEWRWNQHMNRSLDEALAEVEREAHVRLKCFDRWVEQGKLSWVDAYDRMERLLSAVKHMRDLQTQLKLAELRNTPLGVNTDRNQVEGWAEQAHEAVEDQAERLKVIPINASEPPHTEARRQVGA